MQVPTLAPIPLFITKTCTFRLAQVFGAIDSLYIGDVTLVASNGTVLSIANWSGACIHY
jgi:hypothetical protein